MPIGRNDAALSDATSDRVMPRRYPSSQNASSTAIVSAMAGVPMKLATPDAVDPSGSTMLPNVPARMSTSGIAMIPTTSPRLGSPRSSSPLDSAAASISSGTGMLIRLPIHDENSTPPMYRAGIAHTAP